MDKYTLIEKYWSRKFITGITHVSWIIQVIIDILVSFCKHKDIHAKVRVRISCNKDCNFKNRVSDSPSIIEIKD